MKDYLEGWIDAERVHLPPVRQNGFKENIIIREYIPPKYAKRETDHKTNEADS